MWCIVDPSRVSIIIAALFTVGLGPRFMHCTVHGEGGGGCQCNRHVAPAAILTMYRIVLEAGPQPHQ
jgi:hypothetical protein